MITVKPYSVADRAGCLEVFDSNCPHYFDPSERILLENWLNGRDKNMVIYKTSEAERFYVAESEGKLVGCGGYYILKDHKIARMAWGMVLSSCHRRGYGKDLLVYRIKSIQRDFQDHKIALDTSQHTFKFFEQFGFVVTATVNDGYGKDLHRYDMEMPAPRTTK